jgi:hypothetical protein
VSGIGTAALPQTASEAVLNDHHRQSKQHGARKDGAGRSVRRENRNAMVAHLENRQQSRHE